MKIRVLEYFYCRGRKGNYRTGRTGGWVKEGGRGLCVCVVVWICMVVVV